MVQNHINILLYSKFSTASRKLIELIENNDIQDFNLLCIDNKKVREKIEKSDKLNIKEVPCIIRLNQNTGLAESFEGNRAFQLINSYIESINQLQNSVPLTNKPMTPPMMPMKQQVPPMVQQVPPMVQQVPPMTPQVPPMTPQVPQIQSIPSNDSLNISMLQPEPLPKQDSIQKQQKIINGTSIEDLGSDMNKGQTMNTYMHVPKSVEFDIDIENRQRTVKTDRSVKSSESGNIVNRAMQMQKEREQESSMPGQRPIS
jgi:hypothetical protein